MNPSLGAWDIFHLLGAAQGFFLAIIFSFHKRGNPLANRFLGLLLFIFSLKLLEIVAFWSKYLLVFPHLSLVSFPFSYLIGVVFYFYGKHLATGSRKFDKRQWLHVLPFILVFTYTIPYYLLSSDIKLRRGSCAFLYAIEIVLTTVRHNHFRPGRLFNEKIEHSNSILPGGRNRANACCREFTRKGI